MPMMYCVVIADFEDVNTCWFVSANLSKDAFYFNYSDIKKQVNLDFIASSLSDTSIVAIFLVSLGVPGNLQYSPEEFCKSTSSRTFGKCYLFSYTNPLKSLKKFACIIKLLKS